MYASDLDRYSMPTTTFAPTNPELDMAGFQSAQADCLDLVAKHVGGDIVDLLLGHDEGQPVDVNAPTTEHALRVATLMDVATRGLFLNRQKKRAESG